jgi:hypothetical protein
MVGKVRERLAISKQAAQKFDGERFNLRKLNELEVRKQYQIMNTNRFAPLENLSDDEGINMAWGNIKENFHTLAKESLVLQEVKQQKPWFDEECLGF